MREGRAGSQAHSVVCDGDRASTRAQKTSSLEMRTSLCIQQEDMWGLGGEVEAGLYWGAMNGVQTEPLSDFSTLSAREALNESYQGR